MENEHTHEIGMIQQDIAKLRSGHERTLQALEADFNIRLISEYDRYQVKFITIILSTNYKTFCCNYLNNLQSLEDKTARMRKDYEQRLEELAESKRQALRQINDMFEAKLEEKDLMLQEVDYNCCLSNIRKLRIIIIYLKKYLC